MKREMKGIKSREVNSKTWVILAILHTCRMAIQLQRSKSCEKCDSEQRSPGMWSTESSVSIESIEWVDPSYPFARLRIKYIPSFRRNRLFVESGSSVVIFNTHLRISSLYCIIPGIKSKRSVLLVVKILFVCWVWIKRCAQPSNICGKNRRRAKEERMRLCIGDCSSCCAMEHLLRRSRVLVVWNPLK